MQPNDEQICVLLFQKVENCMHISTAYDRALCMYTSLSRQVRRHFVQLLVAVLSLFRDRRGSARINDDRKRKVSGKITQN
jgi:hypothetical protein